MQFDKPLTTNEVDAIRVLVRRRGQREPVAYIVQQKGFYNDDFFVQPGVLCPRPDTETLVDAALQHIDSEQEYFVADIGCGSGCIGLSICQDRPLVKLYAVDISSTALQCTRRNTNELNLQDRVAVLQGSLLQPIPADRPIDFIVSNPPYIPSAHIDKLAPEVSVHEPREALDGGLDGLDIYRQLIPLAVQRMRKALLVEVGVEQAAAVAAIMQDHGLQNIKITTDLGGVERVVEGHQSNQS